MLKRKVILLVRFECQDEALADCSEKSGVITNVRSHIDYNIIGTEEPARVREKVVLQETARFAQNLLGVGWVSTAKPQLFVLKEDLQIVAILSISQHFTGHNRLSLSCCHSASTTALSSR
jgi:hypothetical protein